MTHLCIIFVGFGLAFSALIYVAVKLRWRIAEPMCRNAPRVVTGAAVVLLLMFVMLATAGTNDLAEAFGKSLKQAEYTLRDWISALRFGRG